MLHKLCRPSPLAPSPLAAALFGPAAAARQVGCTPNHLETLSPQTPQHGTALPAMLLQPSCGDSTCQRASHVGVDVALHGGDAAPSPGMRRHRAGCPGTGQKTREPLCGPRPSTSIALTWAGRGDRGDRLRCRGLSPHSGVPGAAGPGLAASPCRLRWNQCTRGGLAVAAGQKLRKKCDFTCAFLCVCGTSE